MNFIYGDNGAGKTSVLEAVFLLGQGKSFRHSDAGPLIRKGEKFARVVADLRTQLGKSARLGIQRTSNEFTARNAGQNVYRRSELFRLLPLQLITPQSHELIERGPELRRRYLDLGLFHVEQTYHQTLTSYQRALKQRNSALRGQNIRLVRSFNDQLVSFAEVILDSRLRLLLTVEKHLQAFLQGIDFPLHVELQLTKGWKSDLRLDEALHRSEAQDISQGFTHAGIHRSQLRVFADDVLANKVLSRGQQKLLVYGLVLSLTRLIADKTSEPPLLLIDDLGAELDDRNCQRVLDYLQTLGVQSFISVLDINKYQNGRKSSVFHVKHGST